MLSNSKGKGKSMVSVVINVPEEMERYIDTSDKEMELERNALMLYPYIKKLVISHGRAAEILGIPKWKLIELYTQFGIPYLDMTDDEFQKEMAPFLVFLFSKNLLQKLDNTSKTWYNINIIYEV